MTLTVLVTVLFVTLLSSSQGQLETTYMASFPSSMRPGQDLVLGVTILSVANSGVPVIVDAILEKDRVELTRSSVTVNSPDPEMVHELVLQVPVDISGSNRFTLKLTGSGGLVFSNETTDLTVNMKTHSVFIQTDKGIYKPGETVKFRVFAVDMNLMPVFGKQTINIIDPNRNKVKQLLNKQSETGIISDELILSDLAVQGDWKIQAFVEGAGEEKEISFSVEEYVLPKFEVTVDLPKYMTPETIYLPVTVKAKYTYGKPVGGSFKVEVYQDSYLCKDYSSPCQIMILTGQLQNGRYTTDLSLSDLTENTQFCSGRSKTCQRLEDIEPYQLYDMKYIFIASVTEDATDVTLNSTAVKSRYHENALEITFPDYNPTSYKVGLNYTGVVKVSMSDESAPDATYLATAVGVSPTIQLSIPFSCNGGRDDEACSATTIGPFSLPITPSGVIPFSFSEITGRGRFSIEAKITLKDGSEVTGSSNSVSLFETVSADSNPIQVTLKADSNTIMIDEPAVFSIKSNGVLKELYYALLSQGEVITRGVRKEVGEPKQLTMSIALPSQIGTNARFVVWQTFSNGEVVADAVFFNVQADFKNQVTASFSDNVRQPGEDVTIQLRADANSQIAVAVVDQSVLLLSSGNDITEEAVRRERANFEPMSENGAMFRCWDCWQPPSANSKDVLKDVGLILFTDGYLYETEKFYPVYFANYEDDEFMEMGVAVADNNMVDSPAKKQDNIIPQTKMRTEFPETWIFSQAYSITGEAVINTKVPDTLTSWSMSAFALNNNTGLGVVKNPTSLTVFKPFFVSLNLPYSVVRGERFLLKAIVFNYEQTSSQVEITLRGSADFESQHVDSTEFTRDDISSFVVVPSNQAVTVVFIIFPSTLGNFDLTITASSATSMDGLVRKLRVTPEGSPNQYTESKLIVLKQEGEDKTTWNVKLPETGVVDGSVKIRMTAQGDILGSTIENLGSLVRQPVGCGEQTMIYMSPNVFVLKYLTASGKGSPTLKSKAVGFIDSGYQRELTFKHTDCSYSAFTSDPEGSNWLTGFVVRNFCHAKQFINVDEDGLGCSVQWMLRTRSPDGSFQKRGRVIHTELTGGSGSSVALTAFLTISLLEVPDCGILQNPMTELESTKTYLEREFDNLQSGDVYTLSIVAYALVLLDSTKAGQALSLLDSLAITKGDKIYFPDSQAAPTVADDVEPWNRYDKHSSLQVETTAYAVLARLKATQAVENVLPSIKWLVSQMNGQGGFHATQDTVLGLQVLSEFAKQATGSGQQNLDINVLVEDDLPRIFETITSQNSLILQSMEIPAASVTGKSIEIATFGQGLGVLQMTVLWYEMKPKKKDDIDLTATSKEKRGEVTVTTCASWKNRETSSGMSIIAINSLSGFIPETTGLLDKYSHNGLMKVETDGSVLNLYLNELTSEEICLEVKQTRQNSILGLQPARVNAYPYYLPADEQVAFYIPSELADADVCDVCPECNDCESTSASARSTVNLGLLAAILLIYCLLV